MIPSLLFNAAVLSSTALAAPFFDKRQAGCPPNHLIVARGSLEPPGPGSMLTLAEKVMAANPGTTMESIVYPATIENYDTSSASGTTAVTQALTTFNQKCPSSKVAMLGYSQGAQIVGDSVAGGGIQGVSRLNEPINPSISSQISAMVLYGDPRHLTTSSFNVGTATMNGVCTHSPMLQLATNKMRQIFPRGKEQSLDPFADKTRAFCNG